MQMRCAGLHVIVMERGELWWSACLVIWSRVGWGAAAGLFLLSLREGYEHEHEGKLVCLFCWLGGGEVDAGWGDGCAVEPRYGDVW